MPRQRSWEKARYWREKISDQQQSGMSIKEFCHRHSISQPSFYAWKRKLKQRESQSSSELKLIPLVVSDTAAEVATQPSVTIRLPGGVQLDIFSSDAVQ